MRLAPWLRAGALLAVACSSRVELGNTGDSEGNGYPVPPVGTGGAPQSGQAGAAGEAGGATGGSASENVRPCCGASVIDAKTDGEGKPCTAEAYVMDPSPVDALILIDRSASMGDPLDETATRWEGIRNAVSDLVTDADVKARGIRLGIEFFPETGGNFPERNCNVDNYASPAVGIDDVDQVGEPILAAIDQGVTEGGATPTVPALEGAYEYARQWASDHVADERVTVVVLVTDGMPNICEDPAGAPERAAEALRNEPSIRTFVLGVGENLGPLNSIAERGGTGEAFIIGEGSAATELVAALKRIARREFACQFQIPAPPSDDQLIDYKRVRVFYGTEDETNPTCAAEVQEIPWVDGRNGCTGSTNGGWYFDDESDPSKLLVCPCTCALFSVGRVDIQYGCAPLGR